MDSSTAAESAIGETRRRTKRDQPPPPTGKEVVDWLVSTSGSECAVFEGRLSLLLYIGVTSSRIGETGVSARPISACGEKVSFFSR